MMDFDIAADRLKKDQQSALARSRAQRAARTASTKAKREAAAARAEAEKRLKEKRLDGERRVRVVNKVTCALARVERRLGVADVSGARANEIDVTFNSVAKHGTADLFEKSPLAAGWKLNATSIHGEGDKIALPPSILQNLTSGSHPDLDPWGAGQSGRPLAFRIGVMNPDYAGFPSSEKMQALVGKVKQDIIALEGSKSSISEESEGQMQQHDIEEMDVSEDESESAWREAYLDELSLLYLAYTHGSVIEFTQEDGCVGLPEPISNALLFPNNYSMVGTEKRNSKIPTKRTVDPASAATSEKINSTDAPDDADDNEKTPGHPAYGKFDVPSCPIEITPMKSLPPGINCTFTPTAQSIRNGFYALKDVKLVLEQSLMRTRATLSKGDVIRTWRRGVSFDLVVSKLSPMEFGVVSCVNTDLNVDIGPPDGMEDEAANEDKGVKTEMGTASAASGRMLSEPTQHARQPSPPTTSTIQKPVKLPPEPAENETQGVCVVQIRGRGSSTGRRRFLVTSATMGDLFAFASRVGGEGYDNVSTFRLVTRFPRKAFRLTSLDGEDCYRPESTLESAGIGEGQLLLLIEQVL